MAKRQAKTAEKSERDRVMAHYCPMCSGPAKNTLYRGHGPRRGFYYVCEQPKCGYVGKSSVFK